MMKSQGKILRKGLITFTVFLLGVFVTSCGDDEVKRLGKGDVDTFSKVSRRMDLLIALDDSPSASFKNPSTMPTGVNAFLNSLVSDGTDWDIRIIAMSLTNPSRHSKVWANKAYGLSHEKIVSTELIDGNKDGKSSISELGQLTSFYAIDTSCGSTGCMFEPGLDNIESLLWGYAKSSNFHRDNAQLAVVVFTNGGDTSDGLISSINPFPVTEVHQSHFDSLADLKDLKDDHVRFFSVVANGRYTNRSCNGSNAYREYRYTQLSQYFGGATINICDQGSFTNAMVAVAESTGPIQLGLYNRLHTNCRPAHVNLDDYPITVTVNGRQIPKDADECKDEAFANSNSACFGWVYEGYRTDAPFNRVFPPREPGEAGLPAGHVIRFNGPSRFYSGDKAFVGC
jgi:hypothetical protein